MHLSLSMVEIMHLDAVLAGTSSSSFLDSSSLANSSLNSSRSLKPIVSNSISSYSVATMGCFPFVATLAFYHFVVSRMNSVSIESFVIDVATTFALSFVKTEPSLSDKESHSLSKSSSFSSDEISS